jgi:hypothetical protein
LEIQERQREQTLKTLKRKLSQGAAEANRGELADDETFFDDVISRLKSQQVKRRSA